MAKVILHFEIGVDDPALMLHAARSAIAGGIQPGGLWGHLTPDGTTFSITSTLNGTVVVRPNRATVSPEQRET